MLKIAKNQTLPLEFATMATAIFGLRGSGKTNTGGVGAEELLKQGQQTIIFDPQNVWWGLKASADGKSAGYPIVIFGGNKGDVPITGTEGKVIADFVVEKQIPCILSLRHLGLNAQRRFLTDFAEQLFFRKGDERYQNPCTIFIDEAHKFIPQKVAGDLMAMLVHRIQMLVTEGRASGIGVVLIDQRPATVNKDVLTQVEMLIVHRITGPQDKNALNEWIRDNADEEQGKEFRTSLAKLSVGMAWFWSPGWLDVFKQVQVRMRETFDSSKTPKVGEKRIQPKKLAAVDLEDLRVAMAATIEQAKSDDPKELRKRIAELERELKNRSASEPERIKVPVFHESKLEVIQASIDSFHADQIRTLKEVAPIIDEYLHRAKQLAEKIEVDVMQLRMAIPNPKPVPTINTVYQNPRPGGSFRTALEQVHSLGPNPAKPIAQAKPVPADGTVSASEQKILDALALCEKLNSPAKKVNIAFLAGYSVAGRFNNLLGGLRTNGFIDYPAPGMIALTDAGRNVASALSADVQSLNDLHELWKSKVSESEWKLISVVIAYHPNAISKQDLADASGYAIAGRFNNLLGHLRTLGAIDYPTQGYVGATDALFPENLH